MTPERRREAVRALSEPGWADGQHVKTLLWDAMSALDAAEARIAKLEGVAVAAVERLGLWHVKTLKELEETVRGTAEGRLSAEGERLRREPLL